MMTLALADMGGGVLVDVIPPTSTFETIQDARLQEFFSRATDVFVLRVLGSLRGLEMLRENKIED